jgi:hypothetical protein
MLPPRRESVTQAQTCKAKLIRRQEQWSDLMEMKLEVVVVPVSDVDRAKRFHEMLGWRLDADFVIS